MAAGLPAGGKVEIEFTAAVWTDVTADADPDPFTIQWGRTSPFSSAQVGTLSGLRLNNTTGKYTPLSQVLTDGVTAHPYYPNVLPRKRVRVSYSQVNGSNLFTAGNSGTFETDALGISDFGGCSHARDTGVFHDGAASMKVTWGTTAATVQQCYSNYSGLIPGITYQVTAWIRCPTGGTRSHLLLSDSVAYTVTSSIVAANSTWQQVTVSFVATANGLLNVILTNSDAATAGQFANIDTIVVQSTQAIRFTGYIKGWPPYLDTAGTAWVLITASDRMDRLSRLKMKAPIPQETSADARAAQWGLTEPAGSTSSLDMSGNKQASLTLVQSGVGGTLTFGDNGPGPETGVKFTPASVSAGLYLTAACPSAGVNAFEAWVQIPSAPASTVDFLSVDGGVDPFGAALTEVCLGVNSSGQVVARFGASTITGTSINDAGWHHVLLQRTHPGASDAWTLWLDSVSVGGVTPPLVNVANRTVNIGQTALSVRASALFTGNVAYPALYTTVPAFARITAHYQAGRSYTGETTGARIQRFLGFAGLTSADWTIDAGKAIVGTYPQAGKDVLSACQDMAISEGGGAVFYVTPDGKARFADRTYRKPTTPVLTFAFEADDDGAAYAPSFDELTLFNSSDASRATASGTQSVQTASNTASIAAYELINDQVTSYATTDQDVLTLAQSRVAANAFPGFRLPQVALDLMTAQTSHYAELPAVQIGSRIRGTGMDQGMAPATQLDLIVEGLKETIGPAQYDAVFDTSPADNPASGIWDDTSYGRAGCSGQTLNTTITNSATTIVIATTAGLPTFTTVGARYPLKIQIGQEIITLNTAPGGAASPQTFTGVTRGVNGTTAAAQTSGSTINLWPAATAAL